jgi:hypothetical protein
MGGNHAIISTHETSDFDKSNRVLFVVHVFAFENSSQQQIMKKSEN